MSNTTRTEIPAELQNVYDKNLLLRVVPNFVHNRWAQTRDIQSNGGTDTVKFRRYSNLSAATTALTEGITPAGSSLARTDITVTTNYYGDFVTITDKLQYESADQILLDAGQVLGDQASDTLDQITRDVIVAGTNVIYGGSATSRATVANTDLITAVMINKAVRTLDGNNSKRVTEMIDPSTGISTKPVNRSYIGIVHPMTEYTLKGLTGFIPVEQYSAKMDMMDGEVGTLGDVRFIRTTNAKIFTAAGAAGIDVYATLIFGMDAYGVTRLAGKALQNIIKPLGSAGTSDPLDQRATSGWKANFAAKILNDNFLVRLEHAVAA